MKISVCMAAYNGGRYIREQVVSILPQLGAEDELVIVDDCSTDQSVSIIEGFEDPRIKLLRNEHNLGVVKAFERALTNSSGNIVFLCDQDDVWHVDKVEKFKSLFREHPELSLALSDANIFKMDGNSEMRPFFGSQRFHPNLLSNLVRNRYLGCTMAFRRSLLAYCLPFPADTPMHDMWIGMVNQLIGKAGFIAEPLVFYRRHGNTVTTGKHASLAQMIRWRCALVRNLTRVYVRRVLLARSNSSNQRL